jgi:hypothetical protein
MWLGKTHFTPEECVNLVCNVLQEKSIIDWIPRYKRIGSFLQQHTHINWQTYMQRFWLWISWMWVLHFGYNWYTRKIPRFLLQFRIGISKSFKKFIPKEFSDIAESVYEFSIKRNPVQNCTRNSRKVWISRIHHIVNFFMPMRIPW